MELLFAIFCDYIAQKIRAHFITIQNGCATHPLKFYSIKSKGTNTSKFHINSQNNVMFLLGRKFYRSILSYIKYIYSALATCPTLYFFRIRLKTISLLFFSHISVQRPMFILVSCIIGLSNHPQKFLYSNSQCHKPTMSTWALRYYPAGGKLTALLSKWSLQWVLSSLNVKNGSTVLKNVKKLWELFSEASKTVV